MRLLLAILLTLPAGHLFAGTEDEHKGALTVYYLRHAQTVANVTHRYSTKNQRTFSPKGLEQREAITPRLAELGIDTVLVSPTWRARQTVRPFLETSGLTAEIWPELTECCWERNRDLPPTPNLEPGPTIELPPEEEPYFTFRSPGAQNRILRRTYADGIRQVRQSYEHFMNRFDGSTNTVLVVGHRHSGGRLLELLLEREPEGKLKLDNAVLQKVVQQPDGSFRLLLHNGDPRN